MSKIIKKNSSKLFSGGFFFNILNYFPFSLLESFVESRLKLNWLNCHYSLSQSKHKTDIIKMFSNIMGDFGITTNEHFLPGAYIPKTGGCIIVGTHDGHFVDIIFLAQNILQYRTDIKFISSTLIKPIKEFRPWCFFIDISFNKKRNTANVAMFKEAIQWLRSGKLLVVFPESPIASEPSNKWEPRLPWSSLPARFAKAANVPIIPIKIIVPVPFLTRLCTNLGVFFYNIRLSMITVKFRTFLSQIHARQVYLTSGKTVTAIIGNAISPKDDRAYGNKLRDHIYGLSENQ